MDRLLRSVIQVAEYPEAAECVANWWAFVDADSEFPTPEDREIRDYLKTFYNQFSAPPDLGIVKTYFERADRIEVVARLDEIRKAQPYIRTNFLSILKDSLEQQEVKEAVMVAKMFAKIVEHGHQLEKPVDGKKVLRGIEDAMAYYSSAIAKIGARKTASLTPLQMVDRLAEFDALPRMFTGIPSLDGEDGIAAHRLVVLGGAPSAGKTSFAVFAAFNWMRLGHPVMFLAVDEDEIGIGSRLRALTGSPKGRAGHEALRRAVAGLPFRIRSEGSVDAAASELQRMAERLGTGKTPVLVVDSLQTVRPSGAAGETAKQRVDAVIAEAKLASHKRGMLVIATSELNRGAYRSKKVEEQSSDMAAGKETGDIEYKGETVLVLRSVKDSATLIDVAVPKNRGARKTPFRLGGESVTARTVRELLRRNPTWSIKFVIGSDLMASAPSWDGWDELLQLAYPLVVGRAGISPVGGSGPSPISPAVSSTVVREALARRAWSEAERYIPSGVMAYIRRHALYAQGPERRSP